MPVQPVQSVRANPKSQTETKPANVTEQKTAVQTKSTQHQTMFDSPQAKAAATKEGSGTTQSQTPAGQSNVYHSQETSRQAMDIRPPGEDKAQFKGDAYNPASTILRGQETEKRESQDKVNRDKREKGGRDGRSGGGSKRGLQDIIPPQRRSTVPIMGSIVMDGQTQDMFMPASAEQKFSTRERTLTEQLKEYGLGALGSSVFTAVGANADPNAEFGIGANLQKVLLNQIVEAMGDTPDILSAEYRKIVREIIQGTLQAAKANDIRIQEAIKMVITGLMAISPHDDDPKIMAEALKIMASEVIYGKLNIGYSMKLAAYALGGSLFMLSIYFKNYQRRLEYTKQLDQKLKYACNDGIWEATGEITGYSETHARANTDRFVAGRIEEEKNFQKNLVKGIFLMPIKKLENVSFIQKILLKAKSGMARK